MPSQWSIDLVNVVSLIFQQSLGPFTKFLVEGFSDMGVFRQLCNHVFAFLYFHKYISYECHLSFEKVQNLIQISHIQRKIREKKNCFWEICIWIGCTKLPLLRREYLCLALNVFTNSLQILNISKTDFFQLNCLLNDQKIW